MTPGDRFDGIIETLASTRAAIAAPADHADRREGLAEAALREMEGGR